MAYEGLYFISKSNGCGGLPVKELPQYGQKEVPCSDVFPHFEQNAILTCAAVFGTRRVNKALAV